MAVGNRPVHIPDKGDRVLTRDGKELGVVEDNLPVSHFCVDGYWLSSDHIHLKEHGVVTLEFDERQIEDYKLDEPAPVDSESPILDAAADDGLSDAERDARRKEMMQGYPSDVEPPRDAASREGERGSRS